MSTLLADVKFALRSMARTPGTSLLMVGTLAVGLAANGVVFNMLDAMVLRPFDFPNTGRLVRVWETARDFDGIDRENVAPANLLDWRAQGAGALRELIAMDEWEANLRGQTAAERLDAALVSPGFFEALGVGLAAGRTFQAEDALAGQPDRVVLGHALWQRSFGGAPMVGRTVTINGQPFEVVGVAPPGFQFPNGAQAWVPLTLPSPPRRGETSTTCRSWAAWPRDAASARPEWSSPVSPSGSPGTTRRPTRPGASPWSPSTWGSATPCCRRS
jgi:putative ABC transport system permease protein